MSTIIIQGPRTKWDWSAIIEEQKTSTYAAMGRKYGVNPTLIHNGIKRWKLKHNPLPLTDNQVEVAALKEELRIARSKIMQLENENIALKNKPDEIPYQPITSSFSKDDRVNQPLDTAHYGKCKCGGDWFLRQNRKDGGLFKACQECNMTHSLKKAERRRLGLDKPDYSTPPVEQVVEEVQKEATSEQLDEMYKLLGR